MHRTANYMHASYKHIQWTYTCMLIEAVTFIVIGMHVTGISIKLHECHMHIISYLYNAINKMYVTCI